MAEYIDREAVMKARHNCKRNCKECDFAIDGDSWCEGEVWIVDILRIHTADVVERKRGKWIVKYPLTTCPVCFNTFDIVGAMNFCPNCGADMREGKDG